MQFSSVFFIILHYRININVFDSHVFKIKCEKTTTKESTNLHLFFFKVFSDLNYLRQNKIILF